MSNQFETLVDASNFAYIPNFAAGKVVALEDLLDYVNTPSVVWVQFLNNNGAWLSVSWLMKDVVDSILDCAFEFLDDEQSDGLGGCLVDSELYDIDVTAMRLSQTPADSSKKMQIADFRFIVLTPEEYRSLRLASRVIALYRPTHPQNVPTILTHQEIKGSNGPVGAGAYFLTAPPTDFKGVVLKAHVRVGNMKFVDPSTLGARTTGEALLDEEYDSICVTGSGRNQVVVFYADQVSDITEFSRYSGGPSDGPAEEVVSIAAFTPRKIFVAPELPVVPIANSWNAFQHLNAGRGWTRAQMLAEYGKWKAARHAESMWSSFKRAQSVQSVPPAQFLANFRSQKPAFTRPWNLRPTANPFAATATPPPNAFAPKTAAPAPAAAAPNAFAPKTAAPAPAAAAPNAFAPKTAAPAPAAAAPNAFAPKTAAPAPAAAAPNAFAPQSAAPAPVGAAPVSAFAKGAAAAPAQAAFVSAFGGKTTAAAPVVAAPNTFSKSSAPAPVAANSGPAAATVVGGAFAPTTAATTAPATTFGAVGAFATKPNAPTPAAQKSAFVSAFAGNAAPSAAGGAKASPWTAAAASLPNKAAGPWQSAFVKPAATQ